MNLRPIKSRQLRNIIGTFVPLLMIPAVIIAGAVAGGDRSYLAITLSVVILSVVLFISGIDRKRTGTRRLVLCAVMSALAVAGRFIPALKPVAAIATVSGIYLGREFGFLVGSMSAVISNFYFGQGPWTPFQMLAWGLIGYFAGLMSGTLKKSRAALYAYGLLSGAFFSLVMDVWTVLWAGLFSADRYLDAVLTSLPHTLLYAVSNLIFLILTSGTFSERLERIKIKYGI